MLSKITKVSLPSRSKFPNAKIFFTDFTEHCLAPSEVPLTPVNLVQAGFVLIKMLITSIKTFLNSISKF